MNFTVGQQEAIRAVWALMADPDYKYLVIQGAAGTGKSEVIKEIAKEFVTKSKTISKLTGDPQFTSLYVTATTNKAVDSLKAKDISKHLSTDLQTIAKLLGAKVVNGSLVLTGKDPLKRAVIIVDEASYLDDSTLEYIEKQTGNTCKVIYVGDPYQLPPPKLTYAPVFERDYNFVNLTEIMRQDKNNPIQKLSLGLREFVKGGDMPALEVDNKHLFLLDNEDEFIDTAIESFKAGHNTKLIGYTNEIVINANAILKGCLEGNENITTGDVLICNTFLPHPIRQVKAETELMVLFAKKKVNTDIPNFPVTGYELFLDIGITVFVPNDNSLIKEAMAKASSDNQARYIERHWADLRPAYACTIHKSQGSTYENVFINLDELNHLPDITLSRLLYVAVSRASHRVYFMGSL